MTEAKSKSLASDAIAIGSALMPTLIEALSGGTPAAILTHAMLVTAEEVALRRIEARTHEHPSPLSLEARKIEDRAVVLEAMGQPLAADDLHRVAKELRKRAAATAPTDPAPRDDEPTR